MILSYLFLGYLLLVIYSWLFILGYLFLLTLRPGGQGIRVTRRGTIH